MICEDCGNCKRLAYMYDDDYYNDSFVIMSTSFRWCTSKEAPTTYDTVADSCNWFQSL